MEEKKSQRAASNIKAREIVGVVMFAVLGGVEHPVAWIGYVATCWMLLKEARKWELKQDT